MNHKPLLNESISSSNNMTFIICLPFYYFSPIAVGNGEVQRDDKSLIVQLYTRRILTISPASLLLQINLCIRCANTTAVS